jgi:transcriptional regulator with XRE-family HTH domain
MDEARRAALADFLRAHRAKLQPAGVGLPGRGRRRTPGLRREEVAQISGVSTTWYTWLEQGRDVAPSVQVLDRIAMALRLSEDERRYLFTLAAAQPVAPVPERSAPELSPAARAILRSLRHCPSIISDRRCGIVGWNRAAATVFIDFGLVRPEDRNLVWLLFTRKEFKALAANWSGLVGGFVALFRSYYGQYIGDPWYERFVERISRANPEFLTFWSHQDVRSAPDVAIEFRHARAGNMLFDLTSLQLQGESDLRFSVYTPSAGSDTEAKLRRLLR